LVVAIPEDKKFTLRSLESGRSIVENHIAEVWGRTYKLILATGNADSHQLQMKESVRRNVAPTEQESLTQACAKDQPLADLVDVLGAEPVPQTEWEDRQDSKKK